MTDPSDAAAMRFAAIVDAFRDVLDVTPPTGSGFGSTALKVNNKIFAMLSTKGEFVVKLPRRRVDALVAAGDGERYDPGHGRIMQEWIAVKPTAEAAWLALAREAIEFVAARG